MKTHKSWPEFKDSPDLRKRWEDRFAIHEYRLPDNPRVCSWVFEKPIFRTLIAYGTMGGYGMSLFGLAALTRHTPRAVWKQVQKEQVNQGNYCGTTGLLVIDSWKPFGFYTGHDTELVPPSEYEDAAECYDEMVEEGGFDYPILTFEEMFKKFPLSKCTVDFNPWELDVFVFTREKIAALRSVFTLGLSKERWSAYHI